MASGAMRLFVGGHADGKMLAVPDFRQSILIPYVSSTKMLSKPGDANFVRVNHWEEERYFLAENEVCGKKFYVYVLSGMTQDEFFQRLIDNYRPNKPGDTAERPSAIADD